MFSSAFRSVFRAGKAVLGGNGQIAKRWFTNSSRVRSSGSQRLDSSIHREGQSVFTYRFSRPFRMSVYICTGLGSIALLGFPLANSEPTMLPAPAGMEKSRIRTRASREKKLIAWSAIVLYAGVILAGQRYYCKQLISSIKLLPGRKVSFQIQGLWRSRRLTVRQDQIIPPISYGTGIENDGLARIYIVDVEEPLRLYTQSNMERDSIALSRLQKLIETNLEGDERAFQLQ